LPDGSILTAALAIETRSIVGAASLTILLVASIVLFATRARTLLKLVGLGQPVERFGDIPKRVELETTVVLGQRKLFQRFVPGLMHALIFWGFLVLLTTILEAMGEVVTKGFTIPLIGRTAWLGFVQDLSAALVLVGVAIAFWIRKVQRPDRFKGSHMREGDYILVWIAGIIVTLYVIKATSIAATGAAPEPAVWSPIANWLSNALSGLSPAALEAVHDTALWAHIVLILGFLVYVPRSKHLHIFASEPNVYFSNTRARGKLRAQRIDLEKLEEGDLVLGAGTLEDLTWKEILDTYACTECGRCQNVCPAWNTGKPLSPKLLIMNLRDHAFDQGQKLLAARGAEAKASGDGDAGAVAQVALNPDVVDDEVIWSCVTCGACMQECPVNIEHVDHIVDMRRYLVQAESRFPQEAGTLLRNLESSSNPWGQPQSQRADWAKELGIRIVEPGETDLPEYLYWVGCAGSFDERAKRIAQALAQVLSRAGLSFGILGPHELCTGDPARRMGNEYLFQTLAEQNVEMLNGLGVTRIVANCPHCFNTLRNEYPDYGGTYEVIHHTELLGRLIAEGRLVPETPVEETLTYHDPCYLGRHNQVYEAPRDVLAKVPGLSTVEMERHRQRGFCCGAGGSRMWMEERLGKRINVERTDEALSTGAGTLGVACPYCMIMLDDGVKQRGEQMRVLDVAQVVASSVGLSAKPPAGPVPSPPAGEDGGGEPPVTEAPAGA
jgi:Fe-S oxidoreductase